MIDAQIEEIIDTAHGANATNYNGCSFHVAGLGHEIFEMVTKYIDYWNRFDEIVPDCLEVVLVWREASRRYDLAHGIEAHLIPGATHWSRIFPPDRPRPPSASSSPEREPVSCGVGNHHIEVGSAYDYCRKCGMIDTAITREFQRMEKK